MRPTTDTTVNGQGPERMETPAVTSLPGQASGLDEADLSIASQDPLFATVFLFAQRGAQSSPGGDTTTSDPETAGVQTAAISTDRASIHVLVLPPLDQILPTLAGFIPSTGGPSAAALAISLVALGGLGVWLRRRGMRRS
jgi:hypothetical protein